MNKSIYMLEQEYYDILMALEETGGELTPELEEELSINESEVADKLSKYRYFINMAKADIERFKAEKAALDEKIKQSENTQSKLRSLALHAVRAFGSDGKSGNKTFKSNDLSAYTRKTKSVQLSDEFVQSLDLIVDPVTNHGNTMYDVEVDMLQDAITCVISVEVPFTDSRNIWQSIEDHIAVESIKVNAKVDKSLAKKIIEDTDDFSKVRIVETESVTIR